MANPMDFFQDFQQALNNGMTVNKLDAEYIEYIDKIESGARYCYGKVIADELLALATFGEEEPIDGVSCYSVNYSVSEKHRGRGFALDIVHKGIVELVKHFKQLGITGFYVDAIIEETNLHSIEVAKKIFRAPGFPKNDDYTGKPSLYFRRRIKSEPGVISNVSQIRSDNLCT